MPDEASPLPLDDQLCFALYGAAMAVGRLYKPQLDRLGITYPQYLVLCALWERGEQPIGVLAARLGLEASTLTPLVKRLATAGFVTRERDREDERQVFVRLTRAGRELRTGSAALGEALQSASGLKGKHIRQLRDDVRELRDAVTAAATAARR